MASVPCWLRAERDTFVISRLLGHSGIAVTANVYLRNPSAEMRDALSRLDV